MVVIMVVKLVVNVVVIVVVNVVVITTTLVAINTVIEMGLYYYDIIYIFKYILDFYKLTNTTQE